MTFDFETPVSWRDAHCQKWDQMHLSIPKALEAHGGPDGFLPMWVADMDFVAAPPIQAAMREDIERGYYGYFGVAEPVTQAVTGWLERQHGWAVDNDAVRYSYGVVNGFVNTISTFTEPGDAVILFTPVYHAFFSRLRAMEREIVESELVLTDGQYEMDLDALGAGLTGREKVIVLCSPHNPGGRIWSVAEIQALAAFCERHDLLLVSDEIHMDLAFPGATFHPAATAAPEVIPRLITLTAASKGFNLAGGETGLVIIPDDTLRAAYDVTAKVRSGTPNRFAMLMMKAAFNEGADWSAAVRAYLAENFRIWRDAISALPGIEVMDMQATYLTWVNFQNTGMEPTEVRDRIEMDARIASSTGRAFGKGGVGYNRFNIAMPRPMIEDAIARMQSAFGDLQ